jgi:hypothetical protein
VCLASLDVLFNPLANIQIAAKLRSCGWRVMLKINEEWAKSEVDSHWLEKANKGDKFAQTRLSNEMEDLKEKLQPKSPVRRHDHFPER